MTWMSKVKTNAKSTVNFPAVAFVKPSHFSLSVISKANHYFIEKDFSTANWPRNLRNELFASNSQALSSRYKLIIVLCSELTLYSEQTFPQGLSDFEIQELFQIQLKSRTKPAQISTFYDYFLLSATHENSTFGYFEVRKDFARALIDQFEYNGFSVVALIPQTIVVINHLIKNNDLQSTDYLLAIMLAQRFYIVNVVNNTTQAIQEHVILDENLTISTIDDLVAEFDAKDQHKPPVIFLNWGLEFDYSGMDQANRQFSSISQAHDVDSMTIKWLREQDDLYKFVALA